MSILIKATPTTKVREGFVILDLETTTQKGKIRAIDGNSIYRIGMEFPDDGEHHTQYVVDPTTSVLIRLRPFKVLCGHNLKFDLEYMRRSSVPLVVKGKQVDAPETPFWDYLRTKATVFDTQFVTYLHSGHTKTFCTLEEACEYWGIPAKKAFDLGAELEKVDHDITKVPDLEKYLCQDLELTKLLVNKMLEDEWVVKNFAWILQMHEGYLGTHEIEFNGMHVDADKLSHLTSGVTVLLDAATKRIRSTLGCDEFEPSSNDHVAAALFGGTIKSETREQVGVYASGAKMGQPRYKIHRKETPLARLVNTTWSSTKLSGYIGKSGKPSVSEEVLDLIDAGCGSGSTSKLKLFIDDVKKCREYQKLLGTYLEGLNKHVRVKDGAFYVFPQINVAQTATGRTSSSKPNMQNNPTHDSVGVASIYTSRYGDEGVLLEVDYKQVEVVALAVLSNDKQLRDDILNKRDIHAETGKPVFGAHMDKDQRRVIKTINFGLIYGGSAGTLATQAGVSKFTAQAAIDSFYKRYPGVREYFDGFKREMGAYNDTYGFTTGNVLEGGFLQKSYVWTSRTGRRYAFKTYYDKWSKSPQVSHTETRNYPIQGLATGDLVLASLGDVWRKVLPKYGDDVKLVGLVHDSLRFDLKLDKLDDLMRDLKYTLENSPAILNRCVKSDLWDMPVRVSFSKGTDFFNMAELDY